MPANLALGIDFGTSGTRAVIVDPQGRLLAQQAVSRYKTTSSQSGWQEQSPESWWNSLVEVVNQLPAELRAKISNMAVDGTSGTLLLGDSAGRAATTALMYNDSRSQTQAARIKTIAPANSGAHGAASSLAKWLWFLDSARHNSELRPLHQADWIANRLCERYGISDYNNSLKLGYDPVKEEWPDWLEELAVPTSKLPKVIAPGQQMGQISAASAKVLGLPQNIQIKAGTTDSIAAFIATGANQLGQAVTSLGSTLVVKVIAQNPVYAADFGVYSHKFGDYWLVGGASNSGGAALLQHFSTKEMIRLSLQIDPNTPTNLHYYPLVSKGERFPINDPNMKARLEPVIKDQPVRFLQGLLEGIAEIEKLAYQTLSRLGAPYPNQVFTAGGGAQNQPWGVIREQFLQCPVVKSRYSEAAYGAALLALRG